MTKTILVKIRNLWSNESRAFSVSIVIKKPSILLILVISITSDINFPLSSIGLFLTYAVCCEAIKIGLQFLMNLLDALAACFWVVFRCPITIVSLWEYFPFLQIFLSVRLKKFGKIILSSHCYLRNYHFWLSMFLETFINFYRSNFPHKDLLDS